MVVMMAELKVVLMADGTVVTMVGSRDDWTAASMVVMSVEQKVERMVDMWVASMVEMTV